MYALHTKVDYQFDRNHSLFITVSNTSYQPHSKTAEINSYLREIPLQERERPGAAAVLSKAPRGQHVTWRQI